MATALLTRARAFAPAPLHVSTFALGSAALRQGGARAGGAMLLLKPRLVFGPTGPSGARALAAAAAGAGTDPADGKEMSGRAKFRTTPIDPAVMKRIYDMRLTAPMGVAMRTALRTKSEEMRREKHFKGFSRGPLYRDIPEPVMKMIGSAKKDKLTFIAGALSLESMPPPQLPEVAFCGRSNVGKSCVYVVRYM